MMQGQLNHEIEILLEEYQTLNGDVIEELHEDPSPLEFLRFVQRNRPFVLRKGANGWKAKAKWTSEYLSSQLQSSFVNIAQTPHGNADSPVNINGELLFVKPYETEISFPTALKRICIQEKNHINGNIIYAQTQNDNLRGEYQSLYQDVPKSIPFARIALQKDPDAINLWIGNCKSTTALHKDPYENIYVQIKGQKHFVLLPPIAYPCVNETLLKAATYVPTTNSNGSETLQAQLDEPLETLPFPIWDPDDPNVNKTPFSKLIKPLKVTLEPGDMLYLPALWFHKVSQSSDSIENFCCAVNYWFDMDYTGSFHPLSSFYRQVSQLVLKDSQVK